MHKKINARWNRMHAKQLRKEAANHIELFSQTHYSMFFYRKKKKYTVTAKVAQHPGDEISHL